MPYPDNMDFSQIDGPEDDRDFHSMGQAWGEQVLAIIANTVASLKAVADEDEGFVFNAGDEKYLAAAIIDAFTIRPDGDDDRAAWDAFQNAADWPKEVTPPASFLDVAAHIVAPLPNVTESDGHCSVVTAAKAKEAHHD